MTTLLTTLSLAEDPCFTCRRIHPLAVAPSLDFLDSFSIFFLSIFLLSLEALPSEIQLQLKKISFYGRYTFL